MVKNTTNFFDPEFMKAPDFSEWQSEFTKLFGDFGKLWNTGKTPSFDVNWLLAERQATARG